MTGVDGAPDLAARVRELERELEARDEQLKVRGSVIRRLRRELADVRTSYERLIRSPPYRIYRGVRRVGRALRPRVLLAKLRGRRLATRPERMSSR
jgi:hypothetical protein